MHECAHPRACIHIDCNKNHVSCSVPMYMYTRTLIRTIARHVKNAQHVLTFKQKSVPNWTNYCNLIWILINVLLTNKDFTIFENISIYKFISSLYIIQHYIFSMTFHINLKLPYKYNCFMSVSVRLANNYSRSKRINLCIVEFVLLYRAISEFV